MWACGPLIPYWDMVVPFWHANVVKRSNLSLYMLVIFILYQCGLYPQYQLLHTRLNFIEKKSIVSFYLWLGCGPDRCIDLQYVKEVFTSCNDLLKKQQFCYILARHVRSVEIWFLSDALPFFINKQIFCHQLEVTLWIRADMLIGQLMVAYEGLL